MGGKEAGTSEIQVDRGTPHPVQCVADFPYFLGLAQELEGDVKRLRPDPANTGCSRTQQLAEFCNPLADPGVDVESYEQTHDFTL